MSIIEKRLDVAVRVAERVFRGASDASIYERASVFARAYEAVAALPGDDEDWAAETLDAAWALVEDAFPRGGASDDVIAALVYAHEAIASTVAGPGREMRRKLRRDA